MFDRRTIPNLLTFARVIAVPLCLALMLLDPPGKAMAVFWIFMAACVTDFFDGYLARKWGVVSRIGSLLDPIADKLLVALMLVYLLSAMGTALFLPVMVILLRELYISGLREFLAKQQVTLPVSAGGKWKTALQMVAISMLLGLLAVAPADGACNAAPGYSVPLACGGILALLVTLSEFLGLPLLYGSAILAITSAYSYTRASLKHLN